nr:ATP-binding protein [Ardenticatena sp.]
MVDILLSPFNILIGPNASGKSTLLDVFRFLQDALDSNVEEAVRRRGHSLQEIVWKHEQPEKGFEFAIEAEIPKHLQTNGYTLLRYEVGIGLDENGGDIIVRGENVWLVAPPKKPPLPNQRTLFPMDTEERAVVHPKGARAPKGYRVVVRKLLPKGNDYFRSERTGWHIQFRLSPKRLALSGLPEDVDRFPIALWFRDALKNGIQTLQLNSQAMRQPCPADAPRIFRPDGSNLPIMVERLMTQHAQRFEWWVGHLKTVLEDLESVNVQERPEDRSRYLTIQYRNGVSVPSWMLSDGTLRLLALTLLAYLPPKENVFLIEEPENGIHPKAIEAVFQALHSVYDGQVFLATHSPVFMALAQPEDLLIFGKTASGATDVVRGNAHPALQTWRMEQPLDILFASGVLG